MARKRRSRRVPERPSPVLVVNMDRSMDRDMQINVINVIRRHFGAMSHTGNVRIITTDAPMFADQDDGA